MNHSNLEALGWDPWFEEQARLRPSTENTCTNYEYLKQMQKMKGLIVDMDGSDKAYYDALRVYDAEKSNQILDEDMQKSAYKDLVKYYNRRVAETTAPKD